MEWQLQKRWPLEPLFSFQISGGLGDTVKHGETGLKADPNNPKDIAEKLLMLIEDENLRKRLGENAKKEAERRWRCEIIAKKLLDLYLKVLNAE